MRKPLLALGLVVSTGLGVLPIAEGMAATPATSTLRSSPASNTSSTFSSSSANKNNAASSTNSSAPNAVSGAEIVQTAMKYLGYPYAATGNSPSTGFSCIGFVSFVYRSLGISLPGDLGGALAYAPQVPFSSLMPGDILYFQNTVWAGLSHAAIYIGGGKFVHAEWYNRGVVVSSFNNDPVDGNYWIGKYLGANRPWDGAAVPPVVGSAPPNVSAPSVTTGPTTSVAKSVANGPTALVSVPSLNVRSKPSMNASVQQVVPSGTAVIILGKRHGWYKVQLPDGTVGWVVAVGIGKGSSPGTSAGPGASAGNTLVGNPTAPSQISSTTQKPAPRGSASIQVSALNVHSSPSIGAPVINTVSRGQQLKVLKKRNGWVEVQLPDGTIGWIDASYTTIRSAKQPSAPRVQPATRQHLSGGSRAQVAMNVRSGPSMGSSVVTVVAPGQSYQILGWSNGWAHVRLSNGTVGWISGSVLGTGSSSTAYKSYSSRGTARASKSRSSSRSSSGGSVLTAGVRVHSAPGVNSPVIGMAGAGTHVQVLGHSGGWALVRLPSGQTGYVLGAYVR